MYLGGNYHDHNGRYRPTPTAFEVKNEEPGGISAEQKALVEDAFFPLKWDMLNAAERREVSEQIDYLNNPEHYELSQYWFEFVAKKQELENAIAEWTALSAASVNELATKDERLQQLQSELKALENAYKNANDGETPLFPLKVPGETPRRRKDRLEAWYKANSLSLACVE